MAKKIEPKVKVIPVVDHLKCQFHECLKMPKHIYCNHIYIRMIMPDDKCECVYFKDKVSGKLN